MEYIPTNLPQYWKIHSREQFTSSIVQDQHVLIFSQDGQTLTAKLPDGSFIAVGGSAVIIISDSIDFSSVTATPQDILYGKAFYNSNGQLQQGTIQSLQASSYTPGTSDIVISSGVYLQGNQTIKGDPNLQSQYILQGISIFGVSGTVQESSDSFDFSGVTAIPSDVLQGRLFYTSGGVLTSGTMQDVPLRAGVVVKENGQLKVQPMGFSGTSAYALGSAQTYTLKIFNKINAEESSDSSSSSISDSFFHSSGNLFISSGETKTVVDVVPFNSVYVDSGGVAVIYSDINNLYINSGGHAGVYEGTISSACVNIGPDTGVRTGLDVHHSQVVISNLDIKQSGWVSVSAGKVYNVTVGSFGRLALRNNAQLQNATLLNSGWITVHSAAVANDVTISSKTAVYVYSGGTAISMTVLSAGSLYVSSGGTALNVTSSQGAVIQVSPYGSISYVQ